jgi:UDP-galactopyranose mutase
MNVPQTGDPCSPAAQNKKTHDLRQTPSFAFMPPSLDERRVVPQRSADTAIDEAIIYSDETEIVSVNVDVLVVGAGFAGSIVAERLASAGRQVLIIDRREHIAGNAFDEFDDHGCLVHRYGPHIFHTNSDRVWEYLSRFTEWHDYEHRVRAEVDGRLLPLPINQDTINQLYGLDLDEEGIRTFLENVREKRPEIKTSEDVVLSTVGRELCDKFFRGYTLKQWGLDLSQLSSTVLARIPTRSNRDDRYFSDKFQAMPKHGYTRMFQNILDHANIRAELSTEYVAAKRRYNPSLTIFTGPIDAYFDHCYGPLPYRSIRFDHEHLPEVNKFQPVGTVNYPNEHLFTRITEFKHMTGQVHTGTSIVREYPVDHGDPYYPIPRPANEMLYNRYKELAEAEKSVVFLGRLAQYRYYNMDQVAGAALATGDKLLGLR